MARGQWAQEELEKQALEAAAKIVAEITPALVRELARQMLFVRLPTELTIHVPDKDFDRTVSWEEAIKRATNRAP